MHSVFLERKLLICFWGGGCVLWWLFAATRSHQLPTSIKLKTERNEICFIIHFCFSKSWTNSDYNKISLYPIWADLTKIWAIHKNNDWLASYPAIFLPPLLFVFFFCSTNWLDVSHMHPKPVQQHPPFLKHPPLLLQVCSIPLPWLQLHLLDTPVSVATISIFITISFCPAVASADKRGGGCWRQEIVWWTPEQLYVRIVVQTTFAEIVFGTLLC